MTEVPSSRLIRLRFPANCADCSRSLAKGTEIRWNSDAKTATCITCPQPQTAPESPTDLEIDLGTAGASARREYELRKAKREKQINDRWGRFSGVVKLLTDEPAKERSWAKGAAGEEKLARVLDQTLGEAVIGLHDRKVPGTKGNIDHLYVTPGGVWVVDAKNYKGRVENRNRGTMFKPDVRLYVDGRDQTKLAAGLGWQTAAVQDALAGQQVPVHKAICFTDAEWNLMNPPFTLDGVFVTHIRSLRKHLVAGTDLDDEKMVTIAQLLSKALPSK
jgi:hypothetical protein